MSSVVDLTSYEENRMSPFDMRALEMLLESFDRTDLICLEIGSWFGAGSTQVIGRFSKELVCVDHWEGNDNDEHKRIVRQINVFEKFKENVDHLGERIVPIKGDSRKVCSRLDVGRFDFVFIDGDHRYRTTVSDILSTRPLVKSGGILAGHDCEGMMTAENSARIIDLSDQDHAGALFSNFSQCHPGVVRAVSEMIEEPKLFAEAKIDLGTVKGYSTIWWTRL